MSKGKIAVLLLAILILNLSVVACSGFTRQGGEAEQLRPAENQKSTPEDTEKTALATPEKNMEETAKEEQTKR